MKILCILALALAAACCVTAEPTWNPADAVKEAEQDIRSGHIKFIGSAALGSDQSVCRSKWLRNIPKPTLESGCVINDIPFRERQEEYARRYNEKIYAYITQKH